ncbi:hypothetical protein P885DRAFT_69080 [Corynascus similis CBS 632.67]
MNSLSRLLLALSCLAFSLGEATTAKPIDVVELPLPPVAPSTDVGACTPEINPRRTGCVGVNVGQFQAGDFTPDGNHVVVNVEFVGAPAAPDPASIYAGEQLILIKADGTHFSNERDYPHVFRAGNKALWGHNVLDCGGSNLASDACTPNKTRIYPIRWPAAPGAPREMRLHPDDVHMGWSAFTPSNGGQAAFFGRLEFNQTPEDGVPRYDLVDVNLLVDRSGKLPIEVDDENPGELRINRDAIAVDELRGFSGTGDEILYLGAPWESCNMDLFAVHVVTGAVRRLTSHPDCTDPIAASRDNRWFVVMDTRASGRQMWMAGMRWIPPLVDMLAAAAASSTRNNGDHCFFQPVLLDRYGDRGDYFGQQVNAGSRHGNDGGDGGIADPNWNGRADPAFSPDGTRIVYWQPLVVSPACGGVNPLPCPVSTAPGGRTYRVMLAHLRSRQPPRQPPQVFNRVPDLIPWATPFPPGSQLPPNTLYPLKSGNYTLHGRVSGFAAVQLTKKGGSSSVDGASWDTVSVVYANYSDQPGYVLNGQERVTVTVPVRTSSSSSFLSSSDQDQGAWINLVDWTSDIVQTANIPGGDGAVVRGTKRTSKPAGFRLEIDVLKNIFRANGTLTTVLDGIEYTQPANET